MAEAKLAARVLDQFYTRRAVAGACVSELRCHLGKRAEKMIWVEPSAGAGAFLPFLPADSTAIDIAPRHAGIERQDFLLWHPRSFASDIVVVGNPPFGKNSSLAQKFFNHAAQFADVIAFIVPRTFQKESLVNRLDRAMHLVREVALPGDAFYFGNEPYDVPTVFQIWQRGNTPRTVTHRRLSHPDFDFVASGKADFAFQRVGARAGLVSREGLHKSAQSHYFIRANIEAATLFARLDAIDWNPVKLRTAGNPSIGKGELVSAYELARA